MPQAKAQSRIDNVLSFEEAQRTVLSHANQVRSLRKQIEQVSILDSLGRVLSQHIVADRAFPPFPRATRDGYAVRSQDVQRVPVELNVVGEVRAGGNFPAGFT